MNNKLYDISFEGSEQSEWQDGQKHLKIMAYVQQIDRDTMSGQENSTVVNTKNIISSNLIINIKVDKVILTLSSMPHQFNKVNIRLCKLPF